MRARQTPRRMADLFALDDRRVRLWTFARVAAEPRAEWGASDRSMAIAKALAGTL